MTATLNPLTSGGTPDLRHSNGLIRGTAEQCPSVDSNHAPSGPEPDVLSAELDGLVRAVGIEPTLSTTPALQADWCTCTGLSFVPGGSNDTRHT